MRAAGQGGQNLAAQRGSGRGGTDALQLRQLLDATSEGVAFCRGGVIAEVNAPLCRLLGRERDAMIGQTPAAVLGVTVPVPGEVIEAEIACGNGPKLFAELHGRAAGAPGDGVWVLAVRDIGERKRAERRIAFLAHHDGLTGLLNRSLFLDRMAEALGQAGRAGLGVALLLIDLDGFKTVNDAMGHPAGDALLSGAGARLARSVRSGDIVARLGGDEFAILVPLTNEPERALALAERIVRLLSEPFTIAGQPVSVGASVGIALYPNDGSAADDLLRAAGLALTRAKTDGKGTCRFFEAGMDSRLRDRRRLEQDLRAALPRGELTLHYQPQFDTMTLAVAGYEALLRWHHPQRGWVPPGEFIPIAEECGLIGEIGQFVLQTACAEAAGWELPYRIAVNLSPAQFRQQDLAQAILAIAQGAGLDPSRLELEVTEGVLIGDAGRALAILRQLRSYGMRIALDDFGTGYSSLSYLRRFPFDVLKIDRSFVQALGKDAGADAIVRMVVALGHSLNLDVIAEGVETPEQLAHLREQACGQVQGFLLGRPAPAADVRQAHEEARAAA